VKKQQIQTEENFKKERKNDVCVFVRRKNLRRNSENFKKRKESNGTPTVNCQPSFCWKDS